MAVRTKVGEMVRNIIRRYQDIRVVLSCPLLSVFVSCHIRTLYCKQSNRRKVCACQTCVRRANSNDDSPALM